MFDAAKVLAAAGIRARQPDISDDELQTDTRKSARGRPAWMTSPRGSGATCPAAMSGAARERRSRSDQTGRTEAQEGRVIRRGLLPLRIRDRSMALPEGYEDLNATIGSTREARRAGTSAATNATAISNTAMAT